VPDSVYVQSNEAEGNRVLVFRRRADGSLTQRGSFSTGGAGTGRPHCNRRGPWSSRVTVAICSSRTLAAAM